MLSLDGKVIAITGAGQGIGAATAKLCAERGATVVITDVDAEQGARTVDEIKAAGGDVQFKQADVREPAQVEAVFKGIAEQYGKLDGLVCAAGVLIGASQTPEELTVEDFEFVLDVNTKGVFVCVKYATPLLEKSEGVLIIVASPAGVTSASSSLAYGASKGGVNGLSMTLAAHLEPRNIRVNTICPGNIRTTLKMTAEMQNAKKRGLTAAEVEAKADATYGLPDGVGKVIAFMLSDDADYLRGSVSTR